MQDPRRSLVRRIDKILDTLHPPPRDLDSNNGFLRGNFAPVAEEHRAVPVEVVDGRLPRDLDGLFLRNGPNPIPGQASKRSHWFDGHGMLHAVRIKGGSATYSNSYIPTPRYQLEEAAGEDVFVRMGEFDDGWSGLLKAMFVEKALGRAAGLDPRQLYTGNNSAVMFRDRFFCLHEAGYPFEVCLADDGSIERGVGYETFGGALVSAASGHSTIDPTTGNFLIHSYMHDGPLTTTEVSARTGRVEQQCGAPNGKSTSLIPQMPDHVSVTHQVMFTKSWWVIFDTPLRMDPANLVRGGLFRWDEAHTLRVGFIPRGAGDVTVDAVRWVDTGARDFVFHAMNAWEEEDGTVVLWCPVSGRFEMAFSGGTERDNNEPFHLVEYRIHPGTGAVERTPVNDGLRLEAPRVRADHLGRFSRYGFAGIVTADPTLEGTFAGFGTWDLVDRKLTASVRFPEGEVGSEPVPVAKPGRSGSNEAFIATYTHDVQRDVSYLLLFDAQSGSPEPIARLKMPHRVPFGFHGLWLDAPELQRHLAAQRLEGRSVPLS